MPQNVAALRMIRYILNFVLALIAFLIVLFLAVPIGFYGMAMYLSPTLPSVAEIKAANFEMPLQIYSQDDKLIGQYGNRMSLPTTYNEVPDKLVKAFLAAEDASFFEHSGISIKGLGRAVTEVITEDENQTGGSTITMQVAKNYFLTPERTFNRKLTELFLSRRIEDELSKDEILTLYVNKIYLGAGAYGIKAGAKKYYSKSLQNLTVAEMAMLAGLPKAPSQNNPVTNPDVAIKRRNWIIGRMYDLGYINKVEYSDAVNSPIGLKLYTTKLDFNMPYLAEMARFAMVSRYGDEIMNSGWRIKLTVDSDVQQDADTAVKRGLIAYDRRHGWRGAEANGEPLNKFKAYGNILPAKVIKVNSRSFNAVLRSGEEITIPWSSIRWARKHYSANRVGGLPSRASQVVKLDDIVRVTQTSDKESWRLIQVPKVQGSLVSLDPENGALLALVGGFDFQQSKFNRATQGWRQPGSTIKPLIYTTALEKGYSPDSIIDDSPIQVGSWKPKNSDGRFYGPMPLRRGLYLSRNLVSIRLLRAVGTADARHLLDQFGLDKEKLPTTLSLALGAGQATPLQMSTAYSAFANGGHRIQPFFIDQIYNYDNERIYQANPRQACAICFNKKLDKTNKALVELYEKQLNNTDADNTAAEDAKAESTDETDIDDETLLGESDQAENLLEDDFNTYDGGPESDRLKPAVKQMTEAQQAPRILTPSVAYNMADILKSVIQRGTGVRARALGRSDIGGKTGTTNEAKDAWFAGFHPTLVSVVWVGFDQPESLGRREYGGVAALPIWMDYMGKQLKGRPYQWVSRSNKAKSKKEEIQIIDITDRGATEVAAGTQKKETKIDTEYYMPPKAKTETRPAQRKPQLEPPANLSDSSTSKP